MDDNIDKITIGEVRELFRYLAFNDFNPSSKISENLELKLNFLKKHNLTIHQLVVILRMDVR